MGKSLKKLYPTKEGENIINEAHSGPYFMSYERVHNGEIFPIIIHNLDHIVKIHKSYQPILSKHILYKNLAVANVSINNYLMTISPLF